ncbi:HEAT repeat domain-containing protein [Leptospira biflexa]|uniref:HEAT repeat domain-containing protein n=1 Tax=Leptospira biflexa TaxID=172 RepID=UPI0010916641|nr:HEAT repeat domain-containing protein [Leptospira biflexa]TGM41772.1 HEAT repeat domain-containing protein [Leptospira biflexa]TGM51974.1 HEAT repeat domain-containing protein [Leptospira biflexa]
MKKSIFQFIIVSVTTFLFIPMEANDLDYQKYQTIKEMISNPHHQEEVEIYQERIRKVTDAPLPYLIRIVQSKDSFVFIRARAIQLLELYQNNTSQTALEKTIEDTHENVHIRKLAIRTYSKFSKIDTNRQSNFMKQFESDKELGPVVKNSKKINRRPKHNQLDQHKLNQLNHK